MQVFWFCKRHFSHIFSEKETISLNNISFYHEAESENIKHRRWYSAVVCSVKKKDYIYLVEFISANITEERLTVLLPESQCATSDWHLFSTKMRHCVKTTGSPCFQNKHSKEKDLTGLHELDITIQIAKVNNPQPLNSYTMCNAKLSGMSSPLLGNHLLEVLEVIQQDSSHWIQTFLKPLESICRWIFRVSVH